MSEPERKLLIHLLGALAYRTQKALRGAPASFDTFDPGAQARSPCELLRHMTSVLGYARTFFRGGHYRAEPLANLSAEADRFHDYRARPRQVGPNVRCCRPIHCG